MKINKLNFLLDVDGVLTDGTFYYNNKGKILKKFGAHDNDFLSLISKKFDIFFISSDKRGYPISKKRVNDMGYKIFYVANENRYKFVKKKFILSKLIFMGDGYYDIKILRESKIGISPKNAIPEAKKVADFVTKNTGGKGAVAEACKYLLKKFKIKI